MKPSVLIVAGAIVLLLPAFLAGRPFVYWDTPTFYGWGHDIVEAVKHPWPPVSEFPGHRGLWAADNFPGAWDRITAQQFQLVMTAIGARSSFYAVPFYLLGSTLTLWAPALVQALLAAWLLWVTASVALGGERPAAYARLVGVLTCATAAPLFVAFLMPDIFAGFAVLTTGLLLCFHRRLSLRQHVGCATVLAYAVAVHLSILPTVVAMLVAGSVAMRFAAPAAPAKRGAAVAVAALACAGLMAALSGFGMKAIFGQDVRPPPFLEGRVIADGPGQQYLRETCATRNWAACLWQDLPVLNTDDIIWPDLSWHDLPRITAIAERRRFLDEQTSVVFGTLLHHPFSQMWASTVNAARQLARFTVADDIGGSLDGLLNVHTDRTMRVVEVVPNIGPCLVPETHTCDNTQVFRYLQRFQYVVMALAVLVLARYVPLLAGWRRTTPGMDAGRRELMAFAFIIASGVVLNAIVCGAFSGPWGRYQARVVWLVPMAAVLVWERMRQKSEGQDGSGAQLINL